MEPLIDGDPRQVGRFEVLARLGSGGMGRVYLARGASGELYALKMIHQFLSDDVQFRRRFQREVAAARRVSGANTAALVDADVEARPPWMAVEYVEGATLTELIDRGGPLTLPSCVRLASGMAQALIDIHAVGLVHRDLKPSNVLMGADGARLIDFGIAQASGASALTMTGLVTGSAGFMSPEQAQADQVTEASDVFALGTVLYFAATGMRPFGEGSIIAVTYRVVHGEPDLSDVRDEGLRALIADCLMKDPQLRPTPQQVLDRCAGILDGSWREHRPAGAPLFTVPGQSVMPDMDQQTQLVAAPLAPGASPVPGGYRDAGDTADAAGGPDADGRRSWVKWALVAALVILLGGGAAAALNMLGPDSTGRAGNATVTEAPEVQESPDEESTEEESAVDPFPEQTSRSTGPKRRPSGVQTGAPSVSRSGVERPGANPTGAPTGTKTPTSTTTTKVVEPPASPSEDPPASEEPPEPTDSPSPEADDADG
jgi:eukaryotic-like serine/threonine-protein kinase